MSRAVLAALLALPACAVAGDTGGAPMDSGAAEGEAIGYSQIEYDCKAQAEIGVPSGGGLVQVEVCYEIEGGGWSCYHADGWRRQGARVYYGCLSIAVDLAYARVMYVGPAS